MDRNIRIEEIVEYQLSSSHKEQVTRLFDVVFEDYPSGRIYYNQLPDFRLLAFSNEELIGHVAVSHRMIRVGEESHPVFGIIDLCVHPDFRLNKLGTKLINSIAEKARLYEMHYLVLTSEKDDFYLKNGFIHTDNPCRWLVIHHDNSYGVLQRNLEEGLMIKEITTSWAKGEVDLLGTMF